MSTRGGVQRVPDKTELRRYIEQGLTQAQIAAAWEKDSGIHVGRTAIAMAIERYGLQSAHPRPRYVDTLPWRVSGDHKMAWDARMLRLEGRDRQGKKLTTDQRRWLTQWKEQLEAQNAVVMYHPGTADGFSWVERTDEDDDIIRRPA